VPSEPGFREGDTEGNTRPEMGSVSAVPPVVQWEAAGISPLPLHRYWAGAGLCARQTALSGGTVSPLRVRTTEVGTERLVDALCRLARGERWIIHPPQGEGVYRTVFSGWRLLLLEIRLALYRFAAALRERGKRWDR
jgi:hypothetical protein